jgi:cytochrome c oxidase subunit II
MLRLPVAIRSLCSVIAILLSGCALVAMEYAAPATTTAATDKPVASMSVDELVSTLNPDLYALEDGKRPATKITNMFTSPASDIARDVQFNTWFNILVYMPFLILPQILLLVVIFKFRDRKDGRKPATFMGNHALEIIWTVIPCLALVVVCVPVWKVLWKMELPPENAKDALSIVVTGRQFAWDYKYQDQGVQVGLDASGFQEPLVLQRDRTTILNITSQDVNHAWWVPAFGVKKDAIIGRYTNTWFTPDTDGFFKGQCAELCGQGHGIMIISAVVVGRELFDTYLGFQRQRTDAGKVWNAVSPTVESVDAAALTDAVRGYLTKDRSPQRVLALRYWIASHVASVTRRAQPGIAADQVRSMATERRAQVEAIIAQHLAALPAAGSALDAVLATSQPQPQP